MHAQVPAGGGARRAVALAITQAHVHVVDLGGGVAAAARTRRLEGRAFSLEDVLGAPERVTMACWAAPRTACFPLRSGDVCALRVGDEAGDSSFVALRDVAGKTRLFGGGAAAPVVALAACGGGDEQKWAIPTGQGAPISPLGASTHCLAGRGMSAGGAMASLEACDEATWHWGAPTMGGTRPPPARTL